MDWVDKSQNYNNNNNLLLGGSITKSGLHRGPYKACMEFC